MKPEIDRQRARLRRRLKLIFDVHEQWPESGGITVPVFRARRSHLVERQDRSTSMDRPI
jgi:hypothetical protein